MKGHVSIVEQIRLIADPQNRIAFVVGSIIGAFVPVAVFALTGHVMESHHNPIIAWQSSRDSAMGFSLSASRPASIACITGPR